MTRKLIDSRRTPIDVNYQSCDSTYVELLIYPNSSADSVTQELGILPSSSQDKGAKIVNSRGDKREAKTTFWSLSSEGKVLSKDVRHHLKWLLGQLTEKELALARLQKQEGLSMSVNCIWWSSGSGGPTLWPEQMSLLAKLNLECSFDIYFSDD